MAQEQMLERPLVSPADQLANQPLTREQEAAAIIIGEMAAIERSAQRIRRAVTDLFFPECHDLPRPVAGRD